jgi:hypothetical protein
MVTRLVHHLNAKCLSEKRVGRRRLQTAVRAIYEGDLAWRYAPTCGMKVRVSNKNGTPLLRDLTANDKCKNRSQMLWSTI